MLRVFAEPAADAAAQAAEVSPVMAMVVQFAPLLLMVLVFYFLLIRPPINIEAVCKVYSTVFEICLIS